MKTEDLKAKGLTDEQVSFVLAENGKDIKALQDENSILKTEKSQLENEKKVLEKEKTEKEKALADLQKDSITKEEYNKKVKEIEDNAKKEKEDYIFADLLAKGLDNAKVINNETTRKAFTAILDREKIKLSDDKKALIGLKEQIEVFKKDAPHFFENKANGYKVNEPGADGGKGDDNNQESFATNFAKEANEKESKQTGSQFFN